jgi:hypothetical protein
VLLHGGISLFLIVAENGVDLGVGLVVDAPHLGAAIVLAKGLVLGERLHFLAASNEERFDLGLLIGGEVEIVGEALELAIGVHLARAAVGALFGRGRASVLGERGDTGAEDEHAAQREGEKGIFHGRIFLRVNLRARGRRGRKLPHWEACRQQFRREAGGADDGAARLLRKRDDAEHLAQARQAAWAGGVTQFEWCGLY